MGWKEIENLIEKIQKDLEEFHKRVAESVRSLEEPLRRLRRSIPIRPFPQFKIPSQLRKPPAHYQRRDVRRFKATQNRLLVNSKRRHPRPRERREKKQA